MISSNQTIHTKPELARALPEQVWATLLDEGIYLAASRPCTDCYANTTKSKSAVNKPVTHPDPALK